MEQQADFQCADGTDILRWFAAGAKEVAAHLKYLNLINVFPVADGDTGTNLSVTLRAMVEKPVHTPSFSGMLQGISQSGLESARGNSGIIFASYVNGLAMESGAFESVTVEQFSDIAQGAVQHLYRAVDHPVEGTMISLIRDWATFISGNHRKYHDFQALFADAYRIATTALEKTKRQLDVLRKNNVVDSGAAGFVRFLEGINRVFADGRAIAVPEEQETLPTFAPDEEAPAFRYCTEALVTVGGTHAAEEATFTAAVRQALVPLGDSLIVALRGGRMKTHIHTNTPELVMEQLRAFGTLGEQKADDMLLQAQLRAKPRGGIGLVTDSIADLPDAILLEHGVSVIPMGVIVRGAAYLDKITMRLKQLFTEMDTPDDYPTSSQPEPERIRALLSERLTQFDSLIVLSVSGALSNTYQTIVQIARQLETPEKRITVIDTRLNSGAQGLMVKLAAERIAAGATHGEVVDAVTSRLSRTKIYVCLNTLLYAVRGGRVPNTVGKLGIRLGLRPIMSLDARGHGTAFGVAFSQKGLTRQILRLAQRAMQHGGVEAYSIVHGGNPTLAAAYEKDLTRITGQAPAFIAEVSAAVAIHSGPGTVAVCLTQKEG
jgi:uncharacterized protein